MKLKCYVTSYKVNLFKLKGDDEITKLSEARENLESSKNRNNKKQTLTSE